MVASNATHVFPLELDRRYPVVVSGDGAWVQDSTGKRYLDAMSGGSMAATLGHGRRDIIGAAAEQASRLSYVHNERLTNPPREQLAAELQDLVAAALGKPLRPKAVHFVTDLPRTRNAKILRRVVKSVYIGKDPGDLSSLENPSALAAIGATRS